MADSQSNEIRIIVYGPALRGDDGRPAAIVNGLERAFPGQRLVWTTAEDGQRTLLTERDAWLAQQEMNGAFPFLHNCDESDFVSVSGWDGEAFHSSGGQAQLEVHADVPLSAAGIAVTSDVLEAIAEAAHAYWGHAAPFDAGLDIARQTRSGTPPSTPPPRGLPALRNPRDIRSPEIPQRLGWLCYWSAAAAQVIGFPDPARDADLLSRSRRTASGGWIVQLTDTPLDLDNPAHLDALLRAYERFPVIGGRAAP
ncbi:DUF5953 family protein [Corallococcus sp. bb12-1]|uniref:DUF5953 family protein n=1 Tax=Corallococcus sp. bb12-1 TaxID=2996784 RepID=UPI002270D234|nr:DUF5953 family protein [Corallococcus sp. bb12-1]MCY1043463.1 DUF5953 family protein [Corallococcus sp. bb12-1]